MKLWRLALAGWAALVLVGALSLGPEVHQRGEDLPPAPMPAAAGATATLDGSSTVEPGSYKSKTEGSTPSRPTSTPSSTPSPTPTATPVPTATPIRGQATWYGGPVFAGKRMANGDPYNEYDPSTAASNLFPPGTELEVTYSKTITVTVKDTGDFDHPVDLSRQAFYDLMGSLGAGRVTVEIKVIGP